MSKHPLMPCVDPKCSGIIMEEEIHFDRGGEIHGRICTSGERLKLDPEESLGQMNIVQGGKEKRFPIMKHSSKGPGVTRRDKNTFRELNSLLPSTVGGLERYVETKR